MPTKKIIATCVDNSSDKLRCDYDEVSVCPICHYALVPQPLQGYYVSPTNGFWGMSQVTPVYVAFFCTRCRNAFMVEYSAYRQSSSDADLVTTSIRGIYPKNPDNTQFPETVAGVSPSFVMTYNQSEIAESDRLTEVAGCGYRKSVEYLVKDYLCYKFPEDSDAIKSEFLGTSIKRITDERIKTLAERATWIGNDETHYVKKHETLDITDMKQFIRALSVYIDSELTFERALSIPPIK